MEEIVRLAVALGVGEEASLLCEAAAEELRGMLRPGVTPEECGEVFCLAAAWLALGNQEGAGAVESFTAGAVSVRRGDGSARREVLRRQALELMGPWLRDEGFLFRGVKG